MNVPKQQQLRKYKAIATGLFLFMAAIFIGSYFIYPTTNVTGYIRAFSEAAMVGALADWFAVTALFKKPLGLPIPHTNLITRNKEKIGDNLGGFITENFLNSETVRPRIAQIKITPKIAQWLQNAHNRTKLAHEIIRIANEALSQLNDAAMEQLIQNSALQLLHRINIGQITGKTLESILNKGFHEEWISLLSKNLANYIAEHPELVEEKVRAESHILIPDFVDDMIAGKITKGMHRYLTEFAQNINHPQRIQITQKLRQLATEMATSDKWENRFQDIKNGLLNSEKTQAYATELWRHLKRHLSESLNRKDSRLHKYILETLKSLAQNYLQHPERSQKLEQFFQVQLFKLIMRHQKEVGNLISNTVQNWDGQSLSNKLELEVGKDLQFIRLNGTIVGGLVGLLLYALSQLLPHL